MLPEKLTNKKNFLFVIFIFFLIAVFIFKNLSIKFEKKEYIGVFFKRPFPLIVINPGDNLIVSGSFWFWLKMKLIQIPFFKNRVKNVSIEGKMVKVSENENCDGPTL